jgi:Zn-dependent protease
MINRDEYDRMVTRIAGNAWTRRNSPRRRILDSVNWLIVLGFVAAMVGLGAILWFAKPTDGGSDILDYLYTAIPGFVGPATLAFVIVGWVFSLCLHEFSHAATAVLGGDDSLSTQKYLSFNPLHYVNPLLSIGLPVLFILLGGIGLPGGAVYLQRGRLRSSNWQVYVSLAGPFANAVFVLLLIVPFQFAVNTGHYYLAGGLGALAFFQIFAVILNLLPIPPLDGFHAIQDWLPASWQYSPWVTGSYGIMLLFLAFWVIPGFGAAFQQIVLNVGGHVGFDQLFAGFGFDTLFFWHH